MTNRSRNIVATVAHNWGLLAFIAIVPLQNLYLEKFPGIGAGLNILNICIIWALLSSIGGKSEVPGKPDLLAPQGKWVLAWALWLCMELFIGAMRLGYMPEGHVGILKDQLVPMLMFPIATRAIRERKQLVYLLVAAALPVPFMFWSFHKQYANVDASHYTDHMRVVNGTFSELGSNEFAAFFAVYTLIALGIFIKSSDRRIRIAMALLCAMGAYIYIFSHSRGAWLAGAAGLVAMGVMVNWRRTLVILAVVFTLSAPLLHFAPQSVQERFSTIFVDEGSRDFSAESRFVFWNLAMEQFDNHPVLGVGLHTFQHMNEYGKDTHNYFIKVLTEGGTIGAIIFLCILTIFLLQTRKLARNATDPLVSGFAVGIFGAVVATIVGNFFGDRFSHYPLISDFWIFMAIVITLNNKRVRGLQEKTDVNDTIKPARQGRAAYPVIRGAVRS